MFSLSEYLASHWIDKTRFAEMYQRATHTTLPTKTNNISQDVIDTISWYIQEDAASKVVKADEISFGGGNDFFAWLWFAESNIADTPVATNDEDEDDQDVISIVTQDHSSTSTTHSETPSISKNATVVSRSDLKDFAQSKWQYIPRSQQSWWTRTWWRSTYSTWWYAQSNPVYSGNKQFKVFEQWSKRKGSKKVEPLVAQPKKEKEHKISEALVKKSTILIGTSITVKEFSEKMGIPLPELVKKMLMNKIICGVNTSIDFDTASLIGAEFGVDVIKEVQSMSLETLMSWNLQAILETDKDCPDPATRPPIVTVMGHVDHGKTSLLDYFRKTAVVNAEAWWITQSIGASSIEHNGKKITFIDTPWHELFTALRSRWAKLTNIAIIVVAADDWIKQQTIEAINHAKEAWVPIIVAATKIDKPDADLEHIRWQLTEHDLTPEERWGTTPLLWVSSKTWEWIAELLDLILLQSELMELKYNPHRTAVWVVLDANKDPKQWVTTSLIMMTGLLKVWHILVVHNTYGKVKKIFDWTGKEVKQATGGDPIMILGLSEIPEPGRIAEVVQSEKTAIAKIAKIREQENLQDKKIWLEWLLNRLAQWERTELKLILKSDGPSSLEALKHALDSLLPPENIFIKKVHSDVGNFTDSDLTLAKASDSLLIGYNITMNVAMKKKADQLWIVAKAFDVIYELTDYIQDLLKWLIKIEFKEVVIGYLNILGVFYKKEKMQIIWWKVFDGKVSNGAQFRLIRDDEILSQWKVTSLQRDQQSVSEVAEGYECGMKVTVWKKILEWDRLEFFVMEQDKSNMN